MKKVPIDFPVDFDGDQIMSLAIGRLLIGGAVCRLFFGADGKLRLVCPDDARTHITFLPPGDDTLGFGPPK